MTEKILIAVSKQDQTLVIKNTKNAQKNWIRKYICKKNCVYDAATLTSFFFLALWRQKIMALFSWQQSNVN